MQKFSVDVVPRPGDGWRPYRKHALTNAIRVDGPFEVETSEGVLTCKDGWLALDKRGYPYPIADDEFRMIYEEVNE